MNDQRHWTRSYRILHISTGHPHTSHPILWALGLGGKEPAALTHSRCRRRGLTDRTFLPPGLGMSQPEDESDSESESDCECNTSTPPGTPLAAIGSERRTPSVAVAGAGYCCEQSLVRFGTKASKLLTIAIWFWLKPSISMDRRRKHTKTASARVPNAIAKAARILQSARKSDDSRIEPLLCMTGTAMSSWDGRNLGPTLWWPKKRHPSVNQWPNSAKQWVIWVN